MRRRADVRFYPRLESIRGIAAMSVLLGHCYVVMVPPNLPFANTGLLPALQVFLSGILNPQPAVLLFFVLSGFALGCQIGRSPLNTGRNVLAYVIRRLARLAPAFVVGISAAALVAILKTPSATEAILHQYGKALIFLDLRLNPVAWTLLVEFAASALFPLIYLVTNKANVAVNSALFAALTYLCLQPSTPLVLQFVVFFHAGLLVAMVPNLLTSPSANTIAAGCGILAITVYAWAPYILAGPARDWAFTRWQNWMWAEIPACATIIYLALHARSPCLDSVLLSKTAGFLGRISYGLYLLHFPILAATISVLPLNLTQDTPIEYRLGAFVIVTPLVAAASILAANWCYQFVEEPTRKCGQALANKVAPRLTSPPEQRRSAKG